MSTASSRLARGGVAGAAAGLVLALFDLGALVTAHAPVRALLGALALDVTAGVALGALGAWLVGAARAYGARAWLRGLAGAAVGAALGFALFSGSGVTRLGLAGPLRVASALGLAALLVARPAWALRVTAWPRWAYGLLGVALYAVHATVLVRQYALLHGLLVVGAFGALAVALRGRRVRGLVLAGMCLAGAVGAVWLVRPMGVRSALRRAPAARFPLLLAARWGRSAVVAEGPQSVSGQGPRLPLAGRDLVLVTVDALRADRLRALGGRGRMPHLDALAARGVVFARAYCTTPHTSYSLASVMLGTHARAVLALPGAERPRTTVADHLRGAGYHTAAFYPPAVFAVDGDRFAALGAAHFGFAHARVEFDNAADRVAAVARWLADQPASSRVFVWVHLFEPHEPYDPQPAHAFGTGREDRYDGECAAADDAIGALVAAFARNGRRPAWMVTADHGEEFGDHGGAYHGTTVYDEQVRVPWVIAVEGVAPRVVHDAVSHVDLAPTVIAGVGLARPPGLRGVDLGGVAQGVPLAQDVFVATGSLRALVRAPWKLVADLSDESLELYHLGRDPHESANLADADEARARALRARLAGWEAEHARVEAERVGGRPETPAALARAEQGDRSAAVEVAALLDHVSPDLARRGATALGSLGVDEPTVRAALVQAQRHPDAGVCDAAAVSLALLGDLRARAGVTRALASTDETLRRRAALGLARLGDPAGVGVLSSWLTDAHAPDHDRDAVAAALRTLRPPGAFDAWVSLLGDLRMAPEAARALGELGDARAIEPLRAALAATPYPLTRGAALGALLDLHDPTAPSRLRAALATPEGVAEAVALAQRVGEPGQRIAGWPRTVALVPERAVSVSLRGRRGGVRRLYLRVEAAGSATVTCEPFAEVAVRAGTREYSVEADGWVRPSSLRCRSDAPVALRGVLVR